ncbi:dihydrodipicolinate synthase family protein [Actinocatenispora rupis]|uniref:4-hydroxy-tetrahydrodipicolinate synthase n=1 Tax=Actinocatenispora rupis TaxID=519421 RepID=A0A8J3JJ40_9ACTN|nr:dihydrodipicolinate synthase family protein [Actinocatenispora rupis]GID15918.1 hypothetical protein Aru02nite_68070 [Actinocatenispora rupis]
MTRPPLHGVLPVLATPFRADWSIDDDALAAEVGWVLDQGADGVVLAMVSEVLRLSTEEREQLAAATCRHVAGRAPVVVSVGAESTHVALRLARHAERVGAAALMAIPPLCTAPDPDGLEQYFTDLAAATALPLIVQDASGYIGDPLPLDLQARLLDTHGEQKILFKPEAVPVGPRLSDLRDATGGRAAAFEGSGGAALVDSYARGIAGTMPGPDLVWAIVALWRALRDGDADRVRAVNEALAPLLAPITGLDSYVAMEKHLLVRQGVLTSERARPPLGFRLDAETRAQIDGLFDRLKDVVSP